MKAASKKQILILCTGNSCRSQMAEGIARYLFGDRYDVYSAGTHPCYVNPNAITVMAEIGVDISGHRSKSVLEFSNQPIDYVITVCGSADQACPTFPGATQKIHWGFSDPVHTGETQEERLNAFRKVRDAIWKKFSEEWVTTLV